MDDLKYLNVSGLIRTVVPILGPHIPDFRSSLIKTINHFPSVTSSSNLQTNLQVLTPLEDPAVLVGTLKLPTLTIKCPHMNCLQFSGEDSITIRCDIAGLEVGIVGKKVHVITWNYIPSKRLGGGFLEIVKWKLRDSSHVLSHCSSSTIDSFPLFSGSSETIHSNAKSRVH